MLRQNGISASEQSDMLRLDAMVMMVQLNIRNLLEARFMMSTQITQSFVSPSVSVHLLGVRLPELNVWQPPAWQAFCSQRHNFWALPQGPRCSCGSPNP